MGKILWCFFGVNGERNFREFSFWFLVHEESCLCVKNSNPLTLNFPPDDFSYRFTRLPIMKHVGRVMMGDFIQDLN